MFARFCYICAMFCYIFATFLVVNEGPGLYFARIFYMGRYIALPLGLPTIRYMLVGTGTGLVGSSTMLS